MPLREKLFDKLSGLYLVRPKGSGVNTTLTAAVAAAGTVLPVAATTGAADKDVLLVGSGDDFEAVVENGAPAGSNITVFQGLKVAQPSGAPVVEGVTYDLGEVVNTGLRDTADRRDLVSDISRNPYGSALGFLMYCIASRFQSVDPDHLAFALGMPLTSVLGAATQADPTQLFTDGDDIGRAPSWLFGAALDENGNPVHVELDACDVDYTGLSIPLSQGVDAGLDAKFIGRMHPRFISTAVNFIADTTKRITRAHFPAAFLDGGFFSLLGGGLSTTTTAATSVGANVISLTSATGVAAGKYYLVEGGGKSQILWVESLASLDATCRTRFKYVFPIGSTVKELTITRPGGFKEGSSTLNIGGSIRPVRFDNKRVQAGARPGTSRFSLGLAPTTFDLTALRRRLGLPSSAIAGNILTVTDLVGTDAPLGAFVKVQRNDGKTWWALLNQCENTIAQLELGLQQTDMLGIPLEHIGQSVHFLQHA